MSTSHLDSLATVIVGRGGQCRLVTVLTVIYCSRKIDSVDVLSELSGDLSCSFGVAVWQP